MRPRGSSSVEQSVLITVAPARVLSAFFDPEALSTWWLTSRSVTTPRALGVYAVQWPPSAGEDEVLGHLGGVFHGTVIEFKPSQEFFVGDAWWLPPDGDPLGPMGLEVRCEMAGPACRLTVVQSGLGSGPRWDRYYEVITGGWKASLANLKTLLEAD